LDLEQKGNGISQPLRITLAMAMWALLLWFFSMGHPSLVPIARAIFIVFVIPSGLGEWLKYKGMINQNRSGVVKIGLMIAAAALWYFEYR